MSMPSPTPGWYPDPAGGGRRWWDGRSWTDFRSAPSVAAVSQPPLPEGTSTGTRWVYLQVLVPLAQLLAQVPYLLSFRSLFQAQLGVLAAAPGSRIPSAEAGAVLTQFAGVFGVFALTFGLSLVLSAAWVVLAFLDVRRLERIGIVQPFHWAWSFLGGVYPIGRAVVLQRRIGRGLGPLWWLLGAVVATVVLTFGLEAVIVLPLFADFASAASTASGLGSGCGC